MDFKYDWETSSVQMLDLKIVAIERKKCTDSGCVLAYTWSIIFLGFPLWPLISYNGSYFLFKLRADLKDRISVFRNALRQYSRESNPPKNTSDLFDNCCAHSQTLCKFIVM